MSEIDTLLLFWAKRSEAPEIHYPLLSHMLDVAAVAQEMWDGTLHPEARQFFAKQLGLSEHETGLTLSFWAGLHDLGKASPGFQIKSETARQRLEARGFVFYGYALSESHGIVTARALTELFKSCKYPPHLGRQVATVIGGHHGIFPRSHDVKSARAESINWRDVRTELFEAITKILSMPGDLPIKGNPEPAFFMSLAGLTSVADWIGSNEDFFPIDQPSFFEVLPELSRKKARRALERLGWIGWHPPERKTEFKQLFSFIDLIRPLQNEAIGLAVSLENSPGLVVIEAPTGEGKTEAAMYLADCWMTALGQKGLYFALPTQATSNQMFSRVTHFVQNRYPSQTVNLQLLHGHASLSAEFEVLKRSFANVFEPKGIGENEKAYDGVSASVVAADWFTYRKRGLLAPFGVGTIDQVLLAVLQTRHVFVRLFGLTGKTVIFDEVHAYDAYMTTLLERLLEWLASLGSSAILLSATLPLHRRNDLLEAYQRGLTQKEDGRQEEKRGKPQDACYPRISWITSKQHGAKQIGTSPQSARVLNIEWVNGTMNDGEHGFSLGERLQAALSRGGCAAVICNTVDRAQEVYRALKSYFPDTAGDGYPELDLLHARFLFGERERREKRTLSRFGKKEGKFRFDDCTEHIVRRPHRAVLVATQIIEQSLDLDFDLMVTEMAPVDLILQRAGRLQRHLQERPPDFEEKPATIWICQPKIQEGGLPDFGGGTEAVYDRHVLLRTWLALNKYSSIRVPEDVEELIEAVYGEDDWSGSLPEGLRQDWQESFAKHEEQLEWEKGEAAERWIRNPDYTGEIWRMTYESREEDDPSLHPAHQALTRLGGLDISAICLYCEDERLYLDADYSHCVNSQTPPDIETTKRLLRRSVRLSRRGLAFSLIEKGKLVPQAWRENPLLRHHYLLCFSADGRCGLGNYGLILDVEAGIVIEYKKV